MNHLRKNYFEYLLIVCFISFVLIAFISQSTFDSGDSVMHFLISKYSYLHPELFFDQWGKPVFTILSSPFSQFGFKGIEIFNCLLATLSVYYTFLSAKKLNYSFPWLAIFILFGATDYFLSMYSGLTEHMFGLFMIAGFYYILSGQIITAVILISFLPFVRSEGFIIMILYGVYLLYSKQWKILPFLAAGTIVISLLGFFYYQDLLWVFHTNPYSNAKDNYGKGSFWHFFIQLYYVAGLPFVILLGAGLFLFIPDLFKTTTWKNNKDFTAVFFILYGCFWGYFFSHVIFWWQGLFHSFGITRVLIAILPLGAVMGISFVDFISKKLNSAWWPAIVVAVGCIAFMFSGNKAAFKIPDDFRPLPDQILVQDIKKFLAVNNLTDENSKYSYAAPYIAMAMDLDYFDPKVNIRRRGKYNYEIDANVPSGTIVIWDNWFAFVEYGLTEEAYNIGDFQRIKEFASGDGKSRFVIFRKK
jgi:hypothetical protein